MFEMKDETIAQLPDGAKIRVIGVGGGGCNAVNTMIKAGLSGVEYIVANTDQQALAASLAPTKVQLGAEITKGLGAGANPEIGRKSALDEYEKLSEVLQNSDMVFITAGMGGGTGTGAAPVIAKLAKELGALTVGVVTKPFFFEGKKRMRQAMAGIGVLEENVDSLITIPNQRLLYLAGESLSLIETFKKADEVLLNAVRGISDLINTTGQINADFADVCTVMSNKGLALMGTGVCAGPDRAIKAATEAISSPLLEDISIDGATGIIINITGSDTLSMHEVNEAVTLIMEAADEEAEIIFGSVIDNEMSDNIKVTVVATGLGGQERVRATKQHRMDSEYRVPEVQQTTANNYTMQASHEERLRPAVPRVEEQLAPRANEQHGIHRQYKVEEEYPTYQKPAHESSPLVQSIQQAADRYEATKKGEEAPLERYPSTTNQPGQGHAGAEGRERNTNTRARTIAEKLGFVNFDEDELDRPSYLRKEDGNPHLDM